MTASRQKIAQYLGEARAGEQALVRVLQSQIAMTPRGLAESVVGQALAIGKTPLDLLRGSGGEEKVLKNAKDACATEALEIATYTALGRLAREVGDEPTAALADSILAQEVAMLERVMLLLPALTDAVVDAEVRGRGTYESAAPVPRRPSRRSSPRATPSAASACASTSPSTRTAAACCSPPRASTARSKRRARRTR
ncbi:MAG: hypothetical protein JWQ18_573 [Conexibacter sp.]|nr:hypothetical protein [Conexibacter sp.]